MSSPKEVMKHKGKLAAVHYCRYSGGRGVTGPGVTKKIRVRRVDVLKDKRGVQLYYISGVDKQGKEHRCRIAKAAALGMRDEYSLMLAHGKPKSPVKRSPKKAPAAKRVSRAGSAKRVSHTGSAKRVSRTGSAKRVVRSAAKRVTRK